MLFLKKCGIILCGRYKRQYSLLRYVDKSRIKNRSDFMSKKNIFKKAAALVLGTAVVVGTTGCNFILTDSEKDLDQVISRVNISESLKSETGYETVATELNTVINDYNLSSEIYKRDLIASFLSTGYNYVQSYGYTYKDTFTMLLDGLIDRTIMTQYAVAYYLKTDEDLSVAGLTAYYNNIVNAEGLDAKTKGLYEAYPEVLAYQYFLTENGTETEDYDRALYNLKKSFNSSLDSLEAQYISEKEEEHTHEEARTLPTNAKTEVSDYYTDKYDIYTGRNTVSADNEYETLDGSTKTTRQKAYNSFLASLQSYSLVKTKGEAAEDTSDFTKLEYYYLELSSTLSQSLINKYYEDLQEDATDEDVLTDEYVTRKYNEMFEQQRLSYQSDIEAFETAMDGVSKDSFLLYGLKDYGYVYNILLPFSASQEIAYKEAQNRGLTQNEVYAARRDILTNVQGKDLRSSWISNDEHVDYSTKGEDGKYYFFEDNFTNNDKYEKLSQYAGQYPFNGNVSENKEVTYEAEHYVDIDDFIGIFEGHIETVAGEGVDAVKDTTFKYDYNATNFKTNGKIDYKKFVYYKGKVNGLNFTEKDFFNPESKSYKALSAVNELMFAYSTDTGCLITYMGYGVSPYGTDFVKEFEWAAQEAVSMGTGSYIVCATDYGWHIVYVSFAYTADGDVYGGYVEAEKDVEGTFSNLFYEYLKDKIAANHTSDTEGAVLNKYDNSASVTRYQKRYQDLLDMDK